MRRSLLWVGLLLVVMARPSGAAPGTALRAAIETMLPQLGGANPPGEVLFTEGFEAGTLDRWQADRSWSVRERPEGKGKCATVTASDNDHEDLRVKVPVPVAPGHIIALFWRSRFVTPGDPLYLRVDYFDEAGKQGKPYARQEQFRETSEWTDNALLVSDWFPEYTRAITLHFHHSPKAGAVSLLDDIRVVDLTRAAGEVLAQQASRCEAMAERLSKDAQKLPAGSPWRGIVTRALAQVRSDLAAARPLEPASDAFQRAIERPAVTLQRLTDAVAALREKRLTTEALLAYRTKPICGRPILPGTQELPGSVAGDITLTAFPGEYEPISLVLWAPEPVPALRLAASDLKGSGGTIAAADVGVKWVKCWYQAGTAWSGIAQDRGHKVLVPELLLNDDTLVKVDRDRQEQSLKLSFPDGPRYVPITDPKPNRWGNRFSLSEFPVKDAVTLQPLDLPAGENKQVWITVKVPAGTKPGRYTGHLVLSSRGKDVGRVALALQVLPFTPSAPKAHYDPSQDFTYSLYYWGELDATGAGSIGYKVKSEQQLRAELRLMYEHGIVAPAVIWSPDIVYRNEPLFRKSLKILRETGMSGRPLYFADSGMIGSPTDAAALEALQANVRKTIAIARELGFTGVYFYGLDEATGDRLLSQRRAWQAVHEAGGKVIVSGYRGQLDAVGDLLDLFNWAGPPDPKQPAEWHERGHKVWNYANPQTPVENPEVYRRNYGVLLWKLDYDGACTYCFMDSSGTAWNDFDCDTYRDHCVAYPTVDGVVGTLALEGFREGAEDVRYLTTLTLVVDRILAAGGPFKAKAAEAHAWLDGIDPYRVDLDAMREGAIRRILALRE